MGLGRKRKAKRHISKEKDPATTQSRKSTRTCGSKTKPRDARAASPKQKKEKRKEGKSHCRYYQKTITRGPPKVGQIFFSSIGCGIDTQDCSCAPRLAWCVYCCVFASHSSLILLSGKS